MAGEVRTAGIKIKYAPEATGAAGVRPTSGYKEKASGGVLNIADYVTGISGLGAEFEQYDVTPLGETSRHRFIKGLQNNDGKVTFGAIDAPATDAKSHMDILKAGLAHEEYVTSLINNIYDAAHSVKDYRTMQFLDWFVKEQGEEEMNASELIKKMELFGGDARSLYMLNQELAARVYSAPSLVLD